MSQPKKALIIDDDPMIRNLVQSILEGVGYEVVSAEDGEHGLSILNAQSAEGVPVAKTFSLIVLDVVMPGMNGLDVLVRLKVNAHTQSIPVLMLTGEDKAEDILAGYNVGADYYITKPFTRQQLLFGVDLVTAGQPPHGPGSRGSQ